MIQSNQLKHRLNQMKHRYQPPSIPLMTSPTLTLLAILPLTFPLCCRCLSPLSLPFFAVAALRCRYHYCCLSLLSLLVVVAAVATIVALTTAAVACCYRCCFSQLAALVLLLHCTLVALTLSLPLLPLSLSLLVAARHNIFLFIRLIIYYFDFNTANFYLFKIFVIVLNFEIFC